MGSANEGKESNGGGEIEEDIGAKVAISIVWDSSIS